MLFQARKKTDPPSTLRNEEARPLTIDRTVLLEATPNEILNDNMVLVQTEEVNFPMQEQQKIGIIQEYLENREQEIEAEGMIFCSTIFTEEGFKTVRNKMYGSHKGRAECHTFLLCNLSMVDLLVASRFVRSDKCEKKPPSIDHLVGSMRISLIRLVKNSYLLQKTWH